MKKYFLLLAALVLPVFPAGRCLGAVNPAIVSADARWLVYADLNGLRASALGKELLALAEKAQLDTGAGKVGIDWQKLLATVGSATAYGANIAPDPKQIDGALVIQGTTDLKKIAESILIQANLANPNQVAELSDLPFPAYALRGPKNDKSGQMDVVIAFPPEPIVIVSKSKEQVVKARDVFRGTAPSLAKTPNAALGKFIQKSSDAFLFTATTVPTESFFPQDGPQARILKMAAAGSFALGERGGETFAHSELLASSDQMAEKLMKILQGLTAMMSLAETNDKQLADFLNSATVARDGQMVTLDVAYSSTRLATMMQSVQKSVTPADPGMSSRPAPLTMGKPLAEWTATAVLPPGSGATAAATRVIENVELKNGSLITLGRSLNGGRNVRFEQVEIAAASGGGSPLTFRPEFMRAVGSRGNLAQFPFPGSDGVYTLTATYLNDPDGKAAYAVSVRDPAPRSSSAPESKAKE